MKYTTPCFVRVEDAEKRTKLLKWMFDIGYAGRHRIDKTNSIVVAGLEEGCVDVAPYNTTDGLAAYGLTDCDQNIELFKALAAMNDENDREQWFVVEHTGSADEMMLADSEDALAYIQSGDGCRKATAEEIIEHFKK